MKKLIITFTLFTFLGFIKTEARGFHYGGYDNYFYAELSPYGEWIEIDYDLVVWRPRHVSYNWKPYLYGSWSWTSHGWYWDSHEPFGWAVYHYGRWYYDDYYGWVWVPGDEWGPAWVEWRYNDNYIGWAPLPPYARFKRGFGISFSISWNSGPRHWHFVNYNRFCHVEVHHHVVHHNYVDNIFHTTKYRTNYYERDGRIVNRGIGRDYVERRAGTTIRKREIERTTSVGDYTKTRTVSTERIKSHRPGKSEVERTRTVERNLKRDHGRSSIKSDKVVTNRTVKKSTTTRSVEKSVSKQNRTKKSNNNVQKQSRSVTKKSYSKRYGDFSSESRVQKNSGRKSQKSEVKRNSSRPSQSSKSQKSVSSSRSGSKQKSYSSSRNSQSRSSSSKSQSSRNSNSSRKRR